MTIASISNVKDSYTKLPERAGGGAASEREGERGREREGGREGVRGRVSERERESESERERERERARERETPSKFNVQGEGLLELSHGTDYRF